MELVSAAPHVFSLLLVLAGVSKLARPSGTRHALRLARLPDGLWLVRGLALGEVAVGAAVLLAGGPLAASALALSYGAFAVFSLRQRARSADCGCFGDEAAPAGWSHVMVDLLGAAAGGAAAVVGAPALFDVLAGEPLGGVPALALLVLVTLLLRLALTALPDLLATVAQSRGEALA
ncbi:MAG: MauE/DoxX family redox-associated membrane protein [Nitriliruptorales bacterium]